MDLAGNSHKFDITSPPDRGGDALSPERRRAIVDGAGRVFARDGYEGASMADIAREVGVSKGTLYNYFPSKAALFSGFISNGCDETLKHILTIAPPENTPEETLRRVAVAVMEMMLSPFRQAIYRMVMSEALKFPELARAFFEAGPSRALNYLSTWLRQEAGRGRLLVPDPDFAAEQFFALCQTKLVMRSRLRLIETADPAEVDRVVDGAIGVFLKAYAAPRLEDRNS
ncbi:TetR/AcrR family transcriptional regulator [Acidisoma cellulosilytica]|uniref:TetR/AcrR family transcriptional regulator n=1 Tax=Acidisoma cellulosilyticum TaxID=2802395 RepID=A0A963Z0G7_9PROT|nr:TetR/AcrR family transcriptional regulator [Acidisoma cellulosilyticum]MCB8879578.1 TetR/AcrR family transcriptional regulator [Acidisoma cellulosilyticum]